MKTTKTMQGVIYLSISSAIFLVTGYIINAWLGRYLGPQDYGVYGIITSLITLINILQTSGLTQSVSKYIAEDPRHSDSVLKTGLKIAVITSGTISLLLYIFSGTIASILHDQSLAQYIRLIAIVFPIYGIYALYVDYYNGLHQFKTQAFMNIVYSITKMTGVFILGVFFYLNGVFWAFILSPLLACSYYFKIPMRTSIPFSTGKILRYSLPLAGFAVFSTLLQSIDILFVKSLLLSDVNTGYYNASQSLARIPYYAVIAISSVTLPSISKSFYGNNIDQSRNIISKALRFTLLTLLPVVVLLTTTSHDVLSFIFSEVYAPASMSLSILVFGLGFFAVFIVLSSVLNGSGSAGTSLAASLIGIIICVLLCVRLIPLYGINGAAMATTISTCIAMIIVLAAVYKKFRSLMPVKSFMRIIVVSIGLYAIASFISVPLILLPFFYLGLSLFYLFSLIMTKELGQEDISMIKSFIPGLKKRET